MRGGPAARGPSTPALAAVGGDRWRLDAAAEAGPGSGQRLEKISAAPSAPAEGPPGAMRWPLAGLLLALLPGGPSAPAQPLAAGTGTAAGVRLCPRSAVGSGPAARRSEAGSGQARGTVQQPPRRPCSERGPLGSGELPGAGLGRQPAGSGQVDWRGSSRGPRK